MLKLAIFVTVLCIAHAYVAVNIYDTDVDTSRASKSSLGSCFPLECDQLCRRTTFHSGACVNGRCKCDILKNFGDLQSCNLRWCEQTCRRMGFPGGVCVGDRCKCDILNSVEDNEIPVSTSKDEENKETPSTYKLPGTCNSLQCSNICRAAGYFSGSCVSDSCKCY